MIDRHNRVIDYIRISITDRCNLRCVYCMPPEGISWMPHRSILSYEELLRLCRIFAQLGMKKVKITGGEPLVRGGLAHYIAGLKAIPGIEKVTLTTNGVLLEEQLEGLVAAGLDGVNISLDSADEETFREITRFSGAEKVLRGLQKALTYENLNVKINCVPLRGRDGSHILGITELARSNKLAVRFIELMPIGLGKTLERLTEAEVRAMIEEAYGPLAPFEGKLGNGPARYYSLEGFQGKVGFISAISHQFCDQCNRVRLTAAGFLKTCLQYEHVIDLKR
jgi:cyclic pyranopterin phosphate synthase